MAVLRTAASGTRSANTALLRNQGPSDGYKWYGYDTSDSGPVTARCTISKITLTMTNTRKYVDVPLQMYLGSDAQYLGLDNSAVNSSAHVVVTPFTSIPAWAYDVIRQDAKTLSVMFRNNYKYSSSTGYTYFWLSSAVFSISFEGELIPDTVRVNQAGVWKTGTPYVNVNGVWTKGDGYVNNNGIWTIGG